MERTGARSIAGPPSRQAGALARLVEGERFRAVALAAIVANALLMGLETSTELRSRLGAEAGAVSAPEHSIAEIRERLDELQAALGAARTEQP